MFLVTVFGVTLALQTLVASESGSSIKLKIQKYDHFPLYNQVLKRKVEILAEVLKNRVDRLIDYEKSQVCNILYISLSQT